MEPPTGIISNHIHAIRYIDGNGDIQITTHEQPMFQYLVGGFGAFGIILDVQIRLIKNCKVKLQASANRTLTNYLQYFKDTVQAPTSGITLHVGRLDISNPKKWGSSDYAAVTPSNYLTVDDKAHCSDAPLWREQTGGTPILRIGLNAISRIRWLQNIYMRQEIRGDSSSSNPELTLNETCNFAIQPLIRSKNSSHQFWLQEYFHRKHNCCLRKACIFYIRRCAIKLHYDLFTEK